MTRHTTFKFCLDPTVQQQDVLARHAGAARFAFNQCLGTVKMALTHRRCDPSVDVPWTPFDLINTFNKWKISADAGRTFVVDSSGVAEVQVTGLAWRREVYQQVFEEAATDCGRALAAWSDFRRGRSMGHRVGFPKFKKKTLGAPTFRLRNKHPTGGEPLIRVGASGHHRSVTLPGIGAIRVHDDTRRLRRMIAKGRARILFATVRQRAGRWWVLLNVEAADLHPGQRHPASIEIDQWVGVDRGVSFFVVAATADGREVARIDDAPKPLTVRIRQVRHLNKSLSRKQRGSHHRRQAVVRLGRYHSRIANMRHHFLHQVSSQLVKTHDRLVIEDLNVTGMMANHSLARAISDTGWTEFARQLRYKAAWRGGQIAIADRWYPSSQICSKCRTRSRHTTLALGERTFRCPCGYVADRDHNAAVNLALWAEQYRSEPRTPKLGAGLPMPADGKALTDAARVSVKPARMKREPKFRSRPVA